MLVSSTPKRNQVSPTSITNEDITIKQDKLSYIVRKQAPTTSNVHTKMMEETKKISVKGDLDDSLSNQAEEDMEDDELAIFKMIEKQCKEIQGKQQEQQIENYRRNTEAKKNQQPLKKKKTLFKKPKICIQDIETNDSDTYKKAETFISDDTP